jgi:hypothetical protein
MYDDIAPFDPTGTLQHEWLNARGAIARFDRGAIEIRVLDVQECPAADLAIVASIVHVLRAMVDQKWTSLAEQQALTTESLHAILLSSIQQAEQAVITDTRFLRQFGWTTAEHCTQGELWSHLLAEVGMLDLGQPGAEFLKLILHRGPLARRIMRRLNDDFTLKQLLTIYGELCDCLATGRSFQ